MPLGGYTYCFDCDKYVRAKAMNCMECGAPWHKHHLTEPRHYYGASEDPDVITKWAKKLKILDKAQEIEGREYLKKNPYKPPPPTGIEKLFDILIMSGLTFAVILILSSAIAWFIDELMI